jgi:hypothetical protein
MKLLILRVGYGYKKCSALILTFFSLINDEIVFQDITAARTRSAAKYSFSMVF